MTKREEDNEQVELLLNKHEKWNAEFEKIEAKSRKAGQIRRLIRREKNCAMSAPLY
jgi:hypothetical protein